MLAVGILLSSSTVLSHGNILYDVPLDFDQEMKAGIVKAAQEFLGIEEEPSGFDFDLELIRVHFKRSLELSVLVHPVDFTVYGFRDDSMMSSSDEIKFDESQREEIAQGIFDQIPERYQKELKYGEEKKLYTGMYKHAWYRYVNEVFVANDHLDVEVDPSTGKIISWRLSVFYYDKEDMNINPAISYEVAQKISEIRLNAEPVDFDPILMIEKDKLVWITKVKSLYPIFVEMDAMDGRVIISGSLRTVLPSNYDYGREVEVKETDLIKKIFEGI